MMKMEVGKLNHKTPIAFIKEESSFIILASEV